MELRALPRRDAPRGKLGVQDGKHRLYERSLGFPPNTEDLRSRLDVPAAPSREASWCITSPRPWCSARPRASARLPRRPNFSLQTDPRYPAHSWTRTRLRPGLWTDLGRRLHCGATLCHCTPRLILGCWARCGKFLRTSRCLGNHWGHRVALPHRRNDGRPSHSESLCGTPFAAPRCKIRFFQT